MVELISLFLVGPVVVGISILVSEAKDAGLIGNKDESSQPHGHLDENYYTRNEPYQRYEGGDYER